MAKKIPQTPLNAVDIPLEAQSQSGDPVDCTQLVNKYGTYEIQPTSDTDNVFPTIAAGLPKTKPPRETGDV